MSIKFRVLGGGFWGGGGSADFIFTGARIFPQFSAVLAYFYFYRTRGGGNLRRLAVVIENLHIGLSLSP